MTNDIWGEEEYAPVFVPTTNYDFADTALCCRYNKMVECKTKHDTACAVCGWNPAVEHKRRIKARKRIAEWQKKRIHGGCP